MPFSRVLYIEQDDFREDPPKKFFRLAPGREVRLRYAYFVTLRRASSRTQTGEVVELHCTYDPATRGGNAPDGRKVKGTHPLGLGRARRRRRGAALRPPVHQAATRTTCRGQDFTANLNPNSLEVADRLPARAEPGRRRARRALPVRAAGLLLRRPRTRTPGTPVFNRTVTLRDTWAKIEQAGKAG